MQEKPPKSHYDMSYDSLERFISYYYQMQLIREINCDKILEIGIGNKTTSNYLISHGFEVTTCDYDEKLEPDIIADVRKLPIEDNCYDCVMACEILEHLPWDDFPVAMEEIKRVTKKYAIVSFPRRSVYFEIVLKFPLTKKWFNKPNIDLCLPVHAPWFAKSSEGHYWEIGLKGFTKKKVRTAIAKHFNIIKELRPVLNPLHYFFILEKPAKT